MSDKQRADLGFGDVLEDFDPAEWQPKPKPIKRANDGPKKAKLAKAAEATGFRSREPQKEAEAPAKPAEQRRRRTGRNAQFNLKAKPETIEAYCAVADRMGWGLGETLERAVELLESEYRAD